jgi:hypothetical protein
MKDLSTFANDIFDAMRGKDGGFHYNLRVLLMIADSLNQTKLIRAFDLLKWVEQTEKVKALRCEYLKYDPSNEELIYELLGADSRKAFFDQAHGNGYAYPIPLDRMTFFEANGVVTFES